MDGHGMDTLARIGESTIVVAGSVKQASETGNTAVVELSAGDLPAFCPNRKMPLWSTHPRVFLDVVNEREAMCPYCGTRYRLARDTPVHDHEFGGPNLHQHRIPGVAHPDADRTAVAQQVNREAANVPGDRQGNTTLELITRWLTGRRGG